MSLEVFKRLKMRRGGVFGFFFYVIFSIYAKSTHNINTVTTCSSMCIVIPSTFKVHSNLNRLMSFLLGGREHPPLIILLFLKVLVQNTCLSDNKNSDITCKEIILIFI